MESQLKETLITVVCFFLILFSLSSSLPITLDGFAALKYVRVNAKKKWIKVQSSIELSMMYSGYKKKYTFISELMRNYKLHNANCFGI